MKFFRSSNRPSSYQVLERKPQPFSRLNHRLKLSSGAAMIAIALTAVTICYAPGGQTTPTTIGSSQAPLMAASIDTTSITPATPLSKLKQPFQASLTFPHFNIITTEFWVGETADSDNGNINNAGSTWDEQWLQHYGGIDDPDQRAGNLPAAFMPHENPFYFAMPYSDLNSKGKRKASANRCLQVSGNQASKYSWCKNSWIAIKYGDRVVYAQWEDAGPFGEDDVAYVFGTAAPRTTRGEHAGLDISPAVSAYLGLNGLNRTAWQFVATKDVPDGPWKQIITTTTGEAAN